MNPLFRKCSGWAREMGFESEEERLKLIWSCPQYKYAELEKWMDEDHHKDTLLKLLAAKRPVGPWEADPRD